MLYMNQNYYHHHAYLMYKYTFLPNVIMDHLYLKTKEKKNFLLQLHTK